MAEEANNTIESIVKSGPLEDLQVFQVSEFYMELEEEGIFIVDGGLELRFPGGTISAGFDLERRMFQIIDKPFKEAFPQDFFYELGNDSLEELRRFSGQRPTQTSVSTIPIEVIVDWTMATEKEHMPVELLLEFNGNETLHFALVRYDFDEETGPSNYAYHPEGGILIAHKAPVAITREEH